MNAVGIDVGKGSSVICILASDNPEISSKPFKIMHQLNPVDHLIQKLKGLDGPTKVVMESTGVYSLGLAKYLRDNGIFVSVVPPNLIKDFHPTSMRNIKTDPADAKKIANYCKMVFDELKEFTPEEALREQLKIANRSRITISKSRITLENSLTALAEKTFPGVDKLFTSPISSNGKLKWVEFYHAFWHVECISSISLNAFKERYEKFCSRNHFLYDAMTAENIYKHAGEQFSYLPKDSNTKKTVQHLTRALKDLIKREKEQTDFTIELASLLPEYETVCSMNGVGEVLAAQLIAEVGDVRRFPNRRSIIAYSGIDPKPKQSGQNNPKSVPISRTGSKLLRKSLFLVMSALIKTKPEDDPVYQFLKKKQSEGKPYKVYMTAGSNKFLRIYYSRVKEVLSKTETC